MNVWDDDFCWCQLNPIYLGLGISVTLTLFTALVGVVIYSLFSKKRFPLATLYPHWALVTGASSGVGKKVRHATHAVALAHVSIELRN